jgi:hypothetical protein
MVDYYVTFTAYDSESGVETSLTIEPTEDGVLRMEPKIRDVWAKLDAKLLRERQEGATSKPKKTASRKPTKRPTVKRRGKSAR